MARGMAAVAAAATPVVAAALLAVALVVTGCRSRPATPIASPPAPGPASPPAAGSDRPGNSTAAPDAGGPRLLIVVGGPARPRAVLRDPGRPHDPGVGLGLPGPLRGGGLAAVVAAPDGRLAAVGQDGATWLAPPLAGGFPGMPAWKPLRAPPGLALPGPVLGAAWSADGAAVVLVAGAPGSGSRRTAIVSLPVDGSAPTSIEVAVEADGPAVAALPRAVVAFVGRDRRDRRVLARVAPSGSFVTLPVAARAIAFGGDLLAIVNDTSVRVGTARELEHGALPGRPLPLEGFAAIGAVAVAPDGTAVAMVRLDGDGTPISVDVLRRTDDAWAAADSLALDPGDGNVTVAWLP